MKIEELLNHVGPFLSGLLTPGIELSIFAAPDSVLPAMDMSRFEKLLVKLVENARDAMPGGGKIQIEILNVKISKKFAQANGVLRAGQHLMLAVTDTGCGMSLEVRSHLFKTIFTTKPIAAGSGEGLSFCYTIVREAGGHIDVYSQLGNGTTFIIYLPLSRQPAWSESRTAK